MYCAIYLRKSRADDPAEPLAVTLERHRQLLNQFLDKMDLTVAPEDIYEEVVSGDSLYARPQMLRLLEAIEAGIYEAVVCIDLQRLGRGSMRDQGIILDVFKKTGTKIITPQKTYDLSNELDEDYTEFEAFMGRQELKMIKRRLQRGIRQTVQDGGYIANAPYGYEKIRLNHRPTLKIIEEEASFVRLIFRLYIEQGIGCQTIAQTLNALGAKPRRAPEFGRTSVMKILKNPTYIGKIVWNQKHCLRPGEASEKHRVLYNPPEKWTVVNGVHPPIISEEDFTKAQSLIAKRSRSASFTGKLENPLAGLVICQNCGRLMARAPRGQAGDYLLCSRPGCMPSTKLAYIESAIDNAVKEYLSELQIHIWPVSQPGEVNRLQAVHSALRTIKSQQARLFDLLEQGVYDFEVFTQRKAELEKRISLIEKTTERLDDEMPSPDLSVQNPMNGFDAGVPSRPAQCAPPFASGLPDGNNTVRSAFEIYSTATPMQKNQLLKAMIKQVVYQKQPGAKQYEFTLDIDFFPIY